MGDDKKAAQSVSDAIVMIGTGPVSLLKAYLLLKRSPETKITFIDAHDRIGGAWYSEKSPDGATIECGCHIWSYVPAVYNFIENEFELELDYMKPSPLFIGEKMKVPYSTKNLIDSYKFIGKSLVKFQWGNLFKMKDDPVHYFKLFGKRNKYPEDGSPDLVKALGGRLKQNPNIEFMLDTKVRSIEIGEQVKVFLQDEELEFNRCIMTSVSEIKEIKFNNEVISLQQDQVDYIHFLLDLDKPLLKKISYWRLVNDPVVHRITDISYQTKGENLLLVGIKGDAFKDKTEKELLKHIEKLLIHYKLIDKDFNIDLAKTHVFPTYYIEEEIREKINSIGSQIELIHSTDLMYGFFRLLKGF